MNVIQRPRAKEFCATMQNYIIDTDVSISFAVKYGGKLILDEEYVPDKNNQVIIRDLGRFCELALWGVWCAGETSWQTNAAGTFSFLINGIEDSSSYVLFSRLKTRKDAVTPGWLSEVNRKVTRVGSVEYVSMLLGPGAHVTVTGYNSSGSTSTATLLDVPSSGGTAPVTIDVSPSRITPLVGFDITRYVVTCNDYGYEFLIDTSKYLDIRLFRYKNLYDMPETLSAVGGLSFSGNNESDTAAMYGIDRKFGLKVSDEYTTNSGVVFLQSDYKLWHNMINAQEVSIYQDGDWLPIIITKQKYERDRYAGILKAVEFTFKLADPFQNNLLEV